jgi:hypothetical protein
MLSRPQLDVCKNIFARRKAFSAVQVKHSAKIQCSLFAAKCILFKDKLLGDQIKLGSPRTAPENALGRAKPGAWQIPAPDPRPVISSEGRLRPRRFNDYDQKAAPAG